MAGRLKYNVIGPFRPMFVLFLPGGLFILAAFLVIHFDLVNPWLVKIENTAPYIILAIGIILGWRFHHSRLVFVLFVLFVSERSLFYFGPGSLYGSGHEKSIQLANGVLLPINIALLYFVKERSLFSLGGMLKTVIILFQTLGVYLFLHLRPEPFKFLSQRFWHFPPVENLPLTQPVLLTYGIILLLFLIGALFSRGPIARGFFWALFATLLGLIAKSKNQSPIIYFSAAGLIIIVAVIETAYAMAFQDELTGLPARRALNTVLHSLGKQYSIAMLDIDFFKKFNDRFGHDVGDQVLCMVASHLRRIGGGGKPFRYGGEEFTVVFPGKHKEEALLHLENLRQSIEAAQFALRDKNRPKKKPRKIKKAKTKTKTVNVTVSIGVAEADNSRTKPLSVVKQADKALYRAKKRGRNCIVS